MLVTYKALRYYNINIFISVKTLKDVTIKNQAENRNKNFEGKPLKIKDSQRLYVKQSVMHTLILLRLLSFLVCASLTYTPFFLL